MNVKISKYPKLFHYRKSVDRQVARAVAAVLKVTVDSVVKMRDGEVNHTFRVSTKKGDFLARVFRNRDWPEDGKLLWIERQLRSKRIAHAKIVYYSRSSKFFPYGFMVTQFLDGVNVAMAEQRKMISLSKTFQGIGAELKSIPRIRLKKFGHIGINQGSDSDFLHHCLAKIRRRIKNLEEDKALPKGLYPVVAKKITAIIAPFNHQLRPVLNHGDANRDNVIFTRDHKLVLVDWDNAYAGIWLEDYAELTYWVDWKRSRTLAGRRHGLIRKNFFRGYGHPSFTFQEIEILEEALHLMKTTNMMQYYRFNKKSPTEFRKARTKFFRLLK